jgi:hypothetical protein
MTSPARLRVNRNIAPAQVALDTATLDEELLAIERITPGFGGMYVDGAGSLVIVHTNPNALPMAIAAIQKVMGDVPQLHAPSIAVRRGNYSFAALAQYQRAIQDRVDVTGLYWSDLDEVNNRVTYGVANDEAAGHVLAAATAAAVPASAVATKTVPRPRFVSSLIDFQDTLAGALQLAFANGSAPCTLGFLATRWGTARYAMTAGHCTPIMGAVDTSFWAAQTFQGPKHAQEFSDPPYAPGLSGCGRLRLCRYSDAAMFQWFDTSQTYALGLIATPATADSTWGLPDDIGIYTHFSIIGEAADSWLTPGVLVSKLGVTTGLTYGRVMQSCVTALNLGGSSKDVVCMVVTDVPANSGDSGGPLLYGWVHPQAPPNISTAYLAGMTSKSDGATNTAFSSIAGIFRDFGSMQTYPGKPCC